MKPDISEFSFGYAITESLCRANAFDLQAAPVFPSLLEEGRQGGGYDVNLPFHGMPLFLQFKLSDYLTRDNAKEANLIGVPFYRMHLRPLRHSAQHRMLLDLENSGQTVYYVAPKFHTSTELNDAYLNQQVTERSLFIQPSSVGELDDADHYVVFKDGIEPMVCSKPKNITHPVDVKAFIINTTNKAKKVGSTTANYVEMETLRNTIIDTIEHVKPYKEIWRQLDRQELIGNRPILMQTAYLARTFLGCEMYVARALER